MPFAEFVPFGWQIPYLSSLAYDFDLTGHYGMGDKTVTFSFLDGQGRQATVASPICYEQLYPAKIAEFVRQGAAFIVLITNEGWWSKSHGAYQVAALSRLRAIETRRTIARCANTGVTAIIDPLGRIYKQVPWWTEQAVAGGVQLTRAAPVRQAQVSRNGRRPCRSWLPWWACPF